MIALEAEDQFTIQKVGLVAVVRIYPDTPKVKMGDTVKIDNKLYRIRGIQTMRSCWVSPEVLGYHRKVFAITEITNEDTHQEIPG